MGRNNHHAGLHMIGFNRYGQYDDLEFYDRLVARKEKEKQQLIKEKLDTIERIKNKEAQKHNETKSTLVKNNNDLDDKQNQDEGLIGNVYFRRCADVYANIFTIALQKKLDIANIVNECECIMANDKTISRRSVLGLTAIESSYIFLQLLAEKMNCTVGEFYMMDKEVRKKITYETLEKILADCLKSSFIEGIASFARDIGQDEYGVSEYEGNLRDVMITRLDINKYYYLDFNILSADNIPECNMEYYIDKVEDKKDKYVRYYFVVGVKPLRYGQPFEYMYGGSVIYSEKTGFMKQFFETVMERYLSQGAVISESIYS